MKKVIFLLAAIGFITIAARTNPEFSKEIRTKNSISYEEKYKACIEACNACLVSCKSCEIACTNSNDTKMAYCAQLCKESVAMCTVSIELMTLNSNYAKEVCVLCAKVCEKCADECEKMKMDPCKKCAADCRKTVKACTDMK